MTHARTHARTHTHTHTAAAGSLFCLIGCLFKDVKHMLFKQIEEGSHGHTHALTHTHTHKHTHTHLQRRIRDELVSRLSLARLVTSFSQYFRYTPTASSACAR